MTVGADRWKPTIDGAPRGRLQPSLCCQHFVLYIVTPLQLTLPVCLCSAIPHVQLLSP